MRIGVPTEIKSDEHRVAITPSLVRELTSGGHEVFIERGAGQGSAIEDATFQAAGGQILTTAKDVFEVADLIVKVKEPQRAELELINSRHTLFTYLHLAPDRELTSALLGSGATCIAYEAVEDAAGRLPLLAPMSEVAGRIATQAGAVALEKPFGGRGMLIGGIPGVASAKVMVLGGGVVGHNAAQVALGMGATVHVYDRSLERLRDLDVFLRGRANLCYSSSLEIEQRLPEMDLVIGAVLLRGARAPRILLREHLKLMKQGSVLVDVSIDQGGCFESSKPTTHSRPTFELDGVVHYCVANMPAAVPITSTYGLTSATGPYIERLAYLGIHGALTADPGLRRGLSALGGALTAEAVAVSQRRPDWTPPDQALSLVAA